MHLGPYSRSARRLGRVAALGIVTAAFIAGCGSGDDDSTSGTTTTSTTTSVAPSDDIEGAWTADAAQIMSANTANLGGAADLSCSGPITLTFTGDGKFSQTGTAKCTIQSQSATATFDNKGDYTVKGSTLTIDGTASNTSIEMDGVTTPTPIGMGDNTSRFEISGDTLEITFEIDPAGTVVQTYTRA